ncbi:FxLYD domain-containing protein [Frankia sp. AgPm24]|uniref:FxLYD domain-containing protein n=1 Tax=Frankia sp. AgPm24 TaxID=631128 RepID=UPI00200DB9AA|nr:FxLYD domain-containing protein [Frankia sp. AgPm24]MCK9921897.1 FxLYD domain-containing protein [Frankia sp. AgPm24]
MRSSRASRPSVVGVTLGLAAMSVGLLVGCSSGGSGVASDVRVTTCTRDPDNHRAVVQGTVRNSSSKRSNYVIQIDVRANDSKIESGLASVLRVAPGEIKTFTSRPVGVDVPSGTALRCTVAHVGRIAAE